MVIPYYRKFRYFHWLIKAYFQKHFAFLLAGLLAGAIIGLNYKFFVNYLLSETEITRIGIIGNFTTKNLPFDIQKLISAGLTESDENWLIKNRLARKLEIRNNGTSYIFYLNNKLVWHDQTPFSVKDVNYFFKDVKIDKISDTIIEFKLIESFAPFPSLVTQPLFKRGLIGLGEYKVESLEFEGQFISKLTLNKKNHKIKFKFYPVEKDGLLGIKLGEIDILQNALNFKEIKNSNLKYEEKIDYHKNIGIFFNTQKGLISEKNFRQALNYALPKNDIKEPKSTSPLSPNSWAYTANIKKYDYNVDTAKNLLSKIIDENNEKEITIKLTAVRPYDKYAKFIATSWEKLGIKVNIEIVSYVPAHFEALLSAQENLLDPDQYPLWHSNGKSNLTGYDNKRIDFLLEKGRKTIDLTERKELYADFQKYLVEDCPAIFLYFQPKYNIIK